jgi:flagellar biogenesis protein FliO
MQQSQTPTINPNNITTETTNNNERKEKQNKKLITIFALVTASLLFLAAGYLLVTKQLMSDSYKAKATANSFMKAMTTGNSNKAISYGYNVSESQKLFYKSSTEVLKGTFTFKESKEKDGKYYVRYDLSSEGNKSARVQLVKVNNKWLVEGLFYGYEQLPTTPAADKDTVNNDLKAPTEDCAVQRLPAQGPDVNKDPRCPSPR